MEHLEIKKDTLHGARHLTNRLHVAPAATMLRSLFFSNIKTLTFNTLNVKTREGDHGQPYGDIINLIVEGNENRFAAIGIVDCQVETVTSAVDAPESEYESEQADGGEAIVNALKDNMGGKILPSRAPGRYGRRKHSKVWVWVPFPDERRDFFADGYASTQLHHPRVGLVNWLVEHETRREYLDLLNKATTVEYGHNRGELDIDLILLNLTYEFAHSQVAPFLSSQVQEEFNQDDSTNKRRRLD